MPPPSSNPDDELAFALARAGIELPQERVADVRAEYRQLREQVALVNSACSGDDTACSAMCDAADEPALTFGVRSSAGAR